MQLAHLGADVIRIGVAAHTDAARRLPIMPPT